MKRKFFGNGRDLFTLENIGLGHSLMLKGLFQDAFPQADTFFPFLCSYPLPYLGFCLRGLYKF